MLKRIVLLFLVAAGVALVGACSQSQGRTVLETSRIADEAKPGTVLIQTTYVASVSVPAVTYHEANMSALLQQAQAALAQGMSQQEVVDAVLEEMLSNLETYLVPTNQMMTVDAQIDGVGSGFFVTPDGYIVTNAHVVTDDPESLKWALAENGLTQFIQKDVQDFNEALGGGATERQIEMLKQAAVNFYVKYMQIGDISRSVAVHLGANLPGITSTTKPVAAEVLTNAVGEPTPGKDVAIIKIAQENCPTLRIGDDKALNVGDNLYPLGYPADATFFPAFDASSINEPSLTAGLVSSKKQMAGGWEVIQTDAAIRGGNSGGPVFNKYGEVVGLSTFTLLDEQGAQAEGAAFVIPMTVVKEFLQRANVTPAESQTAKLWSEALDLIQNERYSVAKEKLSQFETLRPGVPAVAAKKQMAEKAILDGKDKSGPSMVLVAGVAGAVVVVVVVVLFAMRGRGGKMPMPPAGGQPPQIPPTENPQLPQ
ncbi:MAG: trypsin-like peptidase domain-containing protein [Armatimonadetes bacterium]|nr:serine protease [Armatimonadota bacterium]NOG93071.1 trypsin-like peptidase domain-containing protein [Armatimonadota bacterium]